MNQSVLDDKQLSITFSKASTFIKLGFLSVNRQQIPKVYALFCFIISHFQTIAVLLNNAKLYLPKQNDIGGSIIEAYLKLFGFADRFSYTNSTSVFIWAIIMLVYCLHFVVLLLYMSIKLKKQAVIPDYIQNYWSVMNCFHPLVFFYPIHTFNIRVLQGIKLGTFTDPFSVVAMLPFYANIVINFLLSFLITRLCYVVIKTKDPLSCKNTWISTNDIMTKTITPIFWIFAGESDFIEVLVIVATVGDCIKNDLVLFYYLPYYAISTLSIATMMQAITTTLAITTFAARLVSYSSMNLGQYFVHTSWVVLAPIFMRLYKAILEKVLTFIIYTKHTDLRLHYAVHKRYLLTYLIRKRVPPTSDTRIFNFSYFLFQGMLANKGASLEKISLMDPVEIKAQSLQAAKTYYLELVCRYPKSHVAKLTLANFYVKKENSYLLANNLIEEVLNDSPSFSVRVSLSLIRFELQKKTLKQYSQREGEKQSLDLLFYVQITNLNNQLKQQIKRQIRKQVEFWENFVSSKPDMGILTDLALKVDEEKKDILKTWKEMTRIRPSTFYIPPLVYGMYTSMVNNNIMEGEKFIERYQNDILNCNKQLEVDDLNNDTIMAEDTVRITMSGSRTKIGYILDCSTNINQVYGWKKEFLIKQPIVTIMTPYYQHKHDGFLVNHYNTGKTKLLNNTSLLPVVSCDGYIRPSRVHIKMHPFVEQGISYVAVLRTLREPRRMILVRRDGSIDGMSKNFATDMNLVSIDKSPSHKGFEIFSFCPGFRAVNSAFNKKALQAITENAKNDPKSVSSPRKQNPASEDMTPVMTEHDEDIDSHFSWKRFSQKRDKSPHSTSEKSPQEADARVQAIYDMFTTGSQLTFHPRTTHIVNGNKIKLFAGNKAQEVQFKPIFYNVQIITRIHGKEFIKVVYLDRILDEEEKTLFENTSQGVIPPQSLTEPIKHQALIPITSGRLTSSRPLMSPQSFAQKNELLYKVDVRNSESEDDNNSSVKMTIPEEGVDDLDFNHALGQNVRKRGFQAEEDLASTVIELQSATFKEAPSDQSLSQNQGVPSRKSRFSKIVEQARHIIHFDHQLKSFEETEPVQEDNLLRKKLQKIRQKLDREPIHHQNVDRENGSVTGSTASSRGKKVQDSLMKALDATIFTKSAIAFCICYFIFNVLVLILQIFECTSMVSLINDITSKTNVLGNGLFRINSFLNLGLYSRAWEQTLSDSSPQDTSYIANLAISLMFVIYAAEAQGYDTLIREQISHIDPKYQIDFYTKSVTMYDPNNQTKVEIGDYTNFDAAGLILDHSLRLVNEQYSSNFTSTNLNNVEFVLANIFNDFLVSSETATSLLMTDVDDTLGNTTDKISIIFGFSIGAIIVFLLVVFKYFYNITRDSNRFTELLFRFDVLEAQEIKSMLAQFIHSLEVNIHDIEDIREKYDLKGKAKNDKNASRKVALRKPLMDRLLKKQVISFMRLLPAFIVIIIWTVSYYISTKSILSDLSQQQQQIRNSLQMLYQQNLVIVEFIELVCTNATTTVRNIPVEDALLSQLGVLKDVGNFIDQFRDSNGELSTEEQAVFYSFPCSDFGKYSGALASYMVDACYDLSYGAKDTSFTTINTLLYSSIKEYYYEFIESDRSIGEIRSIFQDTSDSFSSLALVAPNMCSILYYTTLTDFESKTDDAKMNAIGFAVTTTVGLFIIAVIVWFRVIRNVLKLEAYSKMILKLIPIQAILANQYLKQYLIQNSNHILDNVKRFL